jgi:hypothetical protein
MFCPQCNSEYRPGFTRCSECDIELVDVLLISRSPEQPDSVPFVVTTGPAPMEEEQICAFLNGHGIPARFARPGFREGYVLKLRGDVF